MEHRRRIPSNGWASKTPAGFIFSVKIPQVITHEKVLADCDAEFRQFTDTMQILGDKLGPMVFQFPFFSRSVFKNQADFLDKLAPFLKKLPHDNKFAVEIRNKDWLDARFADLLREHRVALVLQDRSLDARSDRICRELRTHHSGLDIYPLARRPQGNRGDHEDMEQNCN